MKQLLLAMTLLVAMAGASAQRPSSATGQKKLIAPNINYLDAIAEDNLNAMWEVLDVFKDKEGTKFYWRIDTKMMVRYQEGVYFRLRKDEVDRARDEAANGIIRPEVSTFFLVVGQCSRIEMWYVFSARNDDWGFHTAGADKEPKRIDKDDYRAPWLDYACKNARVVNESFVETSDK